jgi:endonuclease III
VTLEDKKNARILADFVSGIQGLSFEQRECACYTHMGATICDSVLQAGLNYRTVVAPRIRSLVQRWPSAKTTSAFLRMLNRFDIRQVIAWRDSEKPRRIVELTRFCAGHGLETEDCLRRWLEVDVNAESLLSVRGVGPKTVDYIKTLVGLPAVAVDRHLRTFVSWAGVNLTSYDEIKLAVSHAADLLGVHRGALDHAIWSYVSRSRTQNRWINPECGHTGQRKAA